MIVQNNKISPNLTENISGMNQAGNVLVHNAKEGKVSQNVWDIAKDDAIQGINGKDTIYTEAQAKQLDIKEEQTINDTAMDASDFISQCISGQDVKDLEGEKSPLEEYTSSQLERAIKRVKKQREENRDAVEKQVEQNKANREIQEEIAIKNAIGNASGLLAEKLIEADLPPTDENIARFEQAVSMAENRASLSESSMKFFIANELEINPKNIYDSVYSAGKSTDLRDEKEIEEEFEEIKPQVKEILTKGDVPVNQESLEQAKWLYKNNLLLTSENVIKYENLQEIKEIPSENLKARILDGISDGQKAQDVNLNKLSIGEAREALDSLLNLADEKLEKVFVDEKDLVRARRQLEEIRLNMTIEAARTMSAKGINLDISNLKKIVEELRLEEEEKGKNLVLEGNLEVKEENLTIMKDSIGAAKNVLSAPLEFLGTQLEKGGLVGFSEISEEASAYKAGYENLLKDYEAVGTEVRKDLGDSIKKAFGNIDNLLKEINMNNSSENQRAVRILGYNNMEITKENVENMKYFDNKVTSLMKNMTPSVVAEMINRNINPLEKNIDQLTEDISHIQEEIQVEDISFRKFLWKTEHQGDITQDEKQTMIGIYRLLDKIEKSDGAVIGSLVNADRELSFSSLLSAIRTEKTGGMDFLVDSDFGQLSSSGFTNTSIDSQIRAAYNSNIAGKLKEVISPKVLLDSMKEGDPDLENLYDLSRKNDELESADYYNEVAKEIADTMKGMNDEISGFLAALDLPDNVANLKLLSEYMSSNTMRYDKMWSAEESQKLIENFDKPEVLEDLYEEIDKNHQKEVETQKENDDISYESIRNLEVMSKGISFFGKLRSRKYFEVPIVLEKGIMTCNVSIGSESEKKGTVEIYMNSEEFGKIQGTFKVRESRVKAYVTAEKNESLDKLKDIMENFEKDLEKSGFTMESNNMLQASRHFSQKNIDEGPTNRDLYAIAKIFIANISQM